MSLISVPPPMDSRIGLYITDGTVTWIVDDVRDGTPIGSVRGSLYLPKGYIKANGATVNRADYPRLVKWINDNNLWTDDTATYQGLFGKGNGSTTFKLPDFTSRIEWFSGNDAGKYILPGLPNITGFVGYMRSTSNNPGVSGALYYREKAGFIAATTNGTEKANNDTIGFDASRSNTIYGRSGTVQPPSINLIPIIRY